jgi:eukaryotic-like serine/threonine-protein kinase
VSDSAERDESAEVTVVVGSHGGDSEPTAVQKHVAERGDRPLAPGHTIDRFEIVELLGRGAMGWVHRARDPQLRRDVALKLLRERGGEARLLREARAMARIVHPNILPVFDVAHYAEGLCIVMELVEGRTLREWLETGPHSISEVLRTLVAAGRGLQAAHEAGLVHRDFKPSNVMLGDDGRVRVMDFGLARLTGDTSTAVSSVSPSSPLRDVETRSGIVAGSPAYMAPEQHRGALADARSDQFAFCVVLWEALFGKRPFSGQSYRELVAAKHRGPPDVPAAPRIPRRMHEALCRGLAVDRNHRFPSMEALLPCLQHRERRHGVWMAGFALAGGAGTLGLLYAPGESPCQGAEAKLAGTWDGEVRRRVEAAVLQTGVPHAEDTWQRLRPRIDDHVEQWAEAYTEACVATRVRAEHSEEVMDARMRCLERNRLDLAALVEALEHADDQVLEHAVTSFGSLGRLERCSDLESVLREVPPPADPEVEREVYVLEEMLARARALHGAGKIEEGSGLATSVLDRARAVGYEPLEAEAALQVGKLADEAGRHDEAVEALTSAYFTAERWKQHEVQAIAATELMFVLGRRQQRHAPAEQWFKHAEAVVERLGDDDLRATLLAHHAGVLESRARHEEALQALHQALELRSQRGPEHLDVSITLNNIGVVEHARGRYDAALDSFERALEIQERALGPRHPQTVRSLGNVGAACEALGRYDEALDHYRRSLALLEAQFGADHPLVALLINNIGIVLEKRGDLGPALEHYERALAVRERVLEPDHPDVATSIDSVGGVLQEQGRLDVAAEYQRRALAIREEALGLRHPVTAVSLNNLGNTLFHQGQLEEAEELHRRALSIREEALGSGHPHVASSMNNLGRVLWARGQHDDALRAFRRALSIWESKLEPQHPSIAECSSNVARSLGAQGEHAAALEPLERVLWIREHEGVAPQLRAKARFALARGLEAADRDPARARALAEQARDEYLAAEGDFAEPLTEIDAWLRTR